MREQDNYIGSRSLPKEADPYAALHDYLGSVMLYAGIAQDYTHSRDIAGLSHAVRSLLAYAKASKGELAAIIEQAIEDAGKRADAAVEGKPAAQKQVSKPVAQTDEWWNE